MSTASADSETHPRRVLLCFGAGGGIGRGVCKLFAARGYDVVAADVSEEAALETVQIISTGPRESAQRGQKRSADGAVVGEGLADTPAALHVRCNVTIAAEVEAACASTVARFGRIDAAVNCAGIEGARANTAEYPEDIFDEVTAVNYKGVFLCMRAEIKQMLAQSQRPDGMRGAVVNISSTAGLRAFPEFGAYCGSKWAVLGITRTAALEHIGDGVRINAICPATTDTPMVERFAEKWPEWQKKTNASYPIGRICAPEEVAQAALFLAGDACGFHVGEPIILGGGATC